MTAKKRKESGTVQDSGGEYAARDKKVQGDEVRGDKVMGDKVTAGNVGGVGIAIGPGASVHISGDVHYYPIKLRAPLRQVFDPLIEDRMKLFGGREACFIRIAEFIQNPAGGYLMITAPAGFGKTALLANLVGHTPQAFAYHFFTPLYRDGLSEEFFLRNVVEQMAQWHGHSEQLPDRLSELGALYQKFIAEPLEDTQVLVLDGLDEVTTWKLAPYLSRRLPSKLHLVLTVREVGQDWAGDYNLPSYQTSHLPLGGLTRDDVAKVLRAAGRGAIVLAEVPKSLDEVMRVSAYQDNEHLGADPFYVRLLAEDAAEGLLTPENITQQPKGLHAYLDKWWQEIKHIAGDAPARDLFGTLTMALGPIGRADLEAINPTLVDAWAGDFFEDVLRKNRRFVAYDGSDAYQIAHPRLRQYLRTQIKTVPYQDKILAYGAEWQRHYSPYVLKYYARHLVEAGQKEALYALIDKAWMDAQFDRTHSHRAFAVDVDLAIEVAAADPSRDGLVHLMRNCLLYATLGMRSTQLPPELLGVLAQTGESARALDYAELIQDRSKKSKAYCLIGQALMAQDNTEAGKQAMSQALAVAEAMTNESDKADGLSGVAEAMARAGDLTAAGRVATRALAVAESMWNPIRAADALAGVAQAMVQAGDLAAAGRVASQALVAAEAITYGPDKAPALTGVARAMAQARLDAKALHVLQCAFNTGRLAGRSSVFDVLSGCGSILAAIDGSKTLWRICEAFQEVETWWSWQ